MIVVGVSGGVDSSVSALLLSKQHKAVQGVFMHNWDSDGQGPCRAEQDRVDALRVCAALNIPFATRNFAAHYRAQVFAQFLEGYAKGTTPNPDILCNREVKFKVFLEDALAQGADHIATGHYVQKDMHQNKARLLRGKDPSKDQSYFLHAITQEALQRSIFPIGHLEKKTVRSLAQEAGLTTARKKDSTGICFIGEQDFKNFLAHYLPAQEGDIVTETGQAVGRHEGALYYTTGQRAPVGGVKGMPSNLPWFVLEKDVGQNRLVVGQGNDHPRLRHRHLTTHAASWIAGFPPASHFSAQVQIRHLGDAIPAQVHCRDDGTLFIALEHAHYAASIGQSAVLYDGAVCLGGAEIATAA